MPRPPTVRLARPLAAAALAATLLAGCARTQAVGTSRTVQVGVTEYLLRPDAVQVGPGPLTIIVHNYGRLTHDLVITQNGQKQASTGTIWPGQTSELAVDLPKGTYTIASTVISDQALGAYGTLTIS
jgi:plastocyanin